MEVLSGLILSIESEPSVMHKQVGASGQLPHRLNRASVDRIRDLEPRPSRPSHLARVDSLAVNLDALAILELLPQRTLRHSQPPSHLRAKMPGTLLLLHRVGETGNIMFGKCGANLVIRLLNFVIGPQLSYPERKSCCETKCPVQRFEKARYALGSV